jgi:replicative DNA helicase
MDVQRALLSKIIHDQDIITAVNARITLEFFTDENYRRIYEYILDHWRKYGVAADVDVVAQAYPSYQWPIYEQSIGYFIDRLREKRKRSMLIAMLSDASQYVTSTDPDAMDMMESLIREGVMNVRLETAPTLDTSLPDLRDSVGQTLDDRMLNPGYLRGISTGFRGIDYVTGGFQPEQLVTLIGLPKSMKSSMLLAMAMATHAQGRIPLFLGFEMSNAEQIDRLMSLYGKVGLTKIQNGDLVQRERNQIDQAFARLEGGRAFILSTDMENAMTVSGVQAKLMEYNPDVVFIDGAYLMQSELPKAEPGSAQALTDIARSLKMLAQSQRIPIVITTQASATRSKGGKLNPFSAMYTQAYGQSSDVLLGVERVEREDADETGEVMVTLKVLLSRSGPRAQTTVFWDWSKGSYFEDDPSIIKRALADEDED